MRAKTKAIVFFASNVSMSALTYFLLLVYHARGSQYYYNQQMYSSSLAFLMLEPFLYAFLYSVYMIMKMEEI